MVSKLLPNIGISTHRKASKGYQQQGSGRDGSKPQSQHKGDMIMTDGRKGSNTDSERTMTRTSDVMHTEDLELQRVDSDGDFSDGVFGLKDSKRLIGTDKPSAETLRSIHSVAPKRAPPVPPLPPAKGRNGLLGLQPSVQTEIKASTPEPPQAARVPNHGITVSRDVVID